MAILCAVFYAAVVLVILLVLGEAIWSVCRRPVWERSREFDTWRAHNPSALEPEQVTRMEFDGVPAPA